MSDVDRLMIEGKLSGAVFESRRGTTHTADEDFLQAISLSDGATFLAVYDGITTDGTGAADSERAAFILRDKLVEKIVRSAGQNREAFLDELVRFTNQKLYDWNVSQGRSNYSGTTIAAALIDPNRHRLYTAHMGDSRVYLYAGGSLNALTQDHGKLSVVLMALTPEHLDYAPEIHCYLWPSPNIPADGSSFLLLCSDGLHDMIAGRDAYESCDFEAQQKVIEGIIQNHLSKGLPAVADALVAAAELAGKGDDISLILYPLS